MASNIDDITALIEFYEALNGNQWTNNDNWCTELPVKHWHGIVVDKAGRVLGINLSDNGLSGVIPFSFSILDNLTALDLSNNKLQGDFPEAILKLQSIERLDLSNNSLGGILPAGLFAIKPLVSLNLRKNKFFGELSDSVGKMENLQVLILGDNHFLGTLPGSISMLKNLTVINLQRNSFSGTIPSSIGVLFRLEVLNFEYNNFSGEIPATVTTMNSLKQLILRHNRLTGSIPERLEVLLDLEVLYLDHNRLEGGIPRRLGHLVQTKRINLSNNKLTGALPDTLNEKDLVNMKEFNLSNNLLSGELSPMFVLMVLQSRSKKEEVINISYNPKGFFLSNDILTLIGKLYDFSYLDLSKLSLIGTITPSMINFAVGYSVDYSDNYLSGELTLEACRYISSMRYKGFMIKLSGNLGLLLPKDLGILGQELNQLDLSNCSLTGYIPMSIDQFPQGSVLNLAKNKLSGELPAGVIRLAAVIQSTNIFDSLAGLCNAFSLGYGETKVVLDGNLGFTQPKDLQDFGDRIEILNLSYCCLQGPFPLSLTHMPNVRLLNLDGNMISGPLHHSATSFITSLRQRGGTFRMKENHGELYLQDDLNRLGDSCTHLDLSGLGLKKDIPVSIGLLPALEYLSLDGNCFTGHIPLGLLRTILTMRKKGYVVLMKTAGELTLPDDLSSLPKSVYGEDKGLGIRTVDLSECSLIGSIPSSISAFAKLDFSGLKNRNYLLDLNLSGNSFSTTMPLSLARLTNLVSISMDWDGQTNSSKVDYQTLIRYIIRDIAIGVYNELMEELELEVLGDPEKRLWKAMLASNFAVLDDKVRRIVSRHAVKILGAVDAQGKLCLDYATPTMRIASLSGTYFCWRYDVSRDVPLYVSSNAVVVEAVDRGYELKLRVYFWNNLKDNRSLSNSDIITALVSVNLIDGSSSYTSSEPVDSQQVTEDNFIVLCTRFIATHFQAELVPSVAIKFLKSNEFFVREWMIRSSNDFDERFVIDVIKDDNERVLSEALANTPAFQTGFFTDFLHLMVLQKTGINLNKYLTLINATASITPRTKTICQQIGEALFHIHQSGVMHGDVRPCNILCQTSSTKNNPPYSRDTPDKIAFIDLTASGRFAPMHSSNCTFANEYFGVRFTRLMSLPPEAYFKLTNEKEEKMYLNYWGVAALSEDLKPMKLIKSKGKYVAKVFDIEAVNMDGSIIARKIEDLPYKLLMATPLIDIWAFGVLLMDTLTNGRQLITEAVEGKNSVLESNIAFWSEEELSIHIFCHLSDQLLADLLSKMLQPKLDRRIATLSRVLAHPFFGLTVNPDALSNNVKSINLYSMIDSRRRKANEEQFHLTDIPKNKLNRIQYTEHILRKTAFDASYECMTPTCFVILNRKVLSDTPGSTDESIKAKSISWGKKIAKLVTVIHELGLLPYFFDADNHVNVSTEGDTGSSSAELSQMLSNITQSIKNLFTGEKEFYLYLVDEVTMKLLPESPILILPVQVIPRILPLFHLSLRAIATIKGIEGVAEVLRIPYESNSGTMNVDECVLDICKVFPSEEHAIDEIILLREFDLLVKSGMPATVSTEDPWKARLYPLIELDHLYAKCELDLNGLRKVVVAETFVCWTRISDPLKFIDLPSSIPSVAGGMMLTVDGTEITLSTSEQLLLPDVIPGTIKVDTSNSSCALTYDDFMAMLRKGITLKLHSDTPKPGKEPKEVILTYNDEAKGGVLSWKPASTNKLLQHMLSKKIEISKLLSVESGKCTSSFQYAKDAIDEFCFSIISSDRNLNFEATSTAERDIYVQGLSVLVNIIYEDEQGCGPKSSASDSVFAGKVGKVPLISVARPLVAPSSPVQESKAESAGEYDYAIKTIQPKESQDLTPSEGEIEENTAEHKWIPEVRTTKTFCATDKKIYEDGEIEQALSKPSRNVDRTSIVSSLFGLGREAKENRNKYMENDPDSQTHIKMHVKESEDMKVVNGSGADSLPGTNEIGGVNRSSEALDQVSIRGNTNELNLNCQVDISLHGQVLVAAVSEVPSEGEIENNTAEHIWNPEVRTTKTFCATDKKVYQDGEIAQALSKPSEEKRNSKNFWSLFSCGRKTKENRNKYAENGDENHNHIGALVNSPQREEQQMQAEQHTAVFEHDINGQTYYVTDYDNGPIYAKQGEGDVGDVVGVLRNGIPFFYSK